MKKKLTLLLADDDSDDRAFFKEVLSTMAPEVELQEVTDGKLAVEYLTRCGNDHLPCAVIIDYNMPNMSAPQVLEWMESRSWFDHIYKFVWSTSGHTDYRKVCQDKGALHYFQKPNTEEGMEDIMHKILEFCELAV
jgi:CheY-like chemotaxis protein